MSGAAGKPVIEPPPGVTSNFENPEDVLRTVNLTTQYLSIAVVSVFVALRLLIKIKRYSRFDIEDCEWFFPRKSIKTLYLLAFIYRCDYHFMGITSSRIICTHHPLTLLPGTLRSILCLHGNA